MTAFKFLLHYSYLVKVLFSIFILFIQVSKHRLYSIQITHYLSSLLSYSTICIWQHQTVQSPRAQSTLKKGNPYRFCTERSLFIVNVLRLSCTTRCLGVLWRLVVTTLYVLYLGIQASRLFIHLSYSSIQTSVSNIHP